MTPAQANETALGDTGANRTAAGNGGPKDRATPMRRCFATRRTADRDALIRFVVAPGGEVVPDIAGKLGGRGLWLSADRNVLNTACARNLFAKGFRSDVIVGGDLAERVEWLLARRCMEILGLARRAGEAAVGFEKARALVGTGGAAVLAVARDAGADGRRKLSGAANSFPIVPVLSASELAAALGREHVVYVALENGRLADRFIAETGRLAGFRTEFANDADASASSDC